jgi:hypothetical protein
MATDSRLPLVIDRHDAVNGADHYREGGIEWIPQASYMTSSVTKRCRVDCQHLLILLTCGLSSVQLKFSVKGIIRQMKRNK